MSQNKTTLLKNPGHPRSCGRIKAQLLNWIAPSSWTMRHLTREIQEIKKRFLAPIECLETGTIRSYSENHQSTLRISEALGSYGRLTSVDLDPLSIAVSRDLCRGKDNIQWVESDSISYLKTLKQPKFHFVFLDSVNDPEMIFEEFRQVVPLMMEGGVMIVDDAGITQGGLSLDRKSKGRKGQKIWRLLKDSKLEFEILGTNWFHGTQLKIPVSAESKKKILAHLSNPVQAWY